MKQASDEETKYQQFTPRVKRWTLKINQRSSISHPRADKLVPPLRVLGQKRGSARLLIQRFSIWRTGSVLDDSAAVSTSAEWTTSGGAMPRSTFQTPRCAARRSAGQKAAGTG